MNCRLKMEKNLQLRNEYLLQEIAVQKKIISQLLQLTLSSSYLAKPNLPPRCSHSHAYCRIDHSKYNLNFVKNKNLSSNCDKLNVNKKKKEIRIQDPAAGNLRSTEEAFIRMMVRKVNSLQSFYGAPPIPKYDESSEFVHEELKFIWENVFTLFDQKILRENDVQNFSGKFH